VTINSVHVTVKIAVLIIFFRMLSIERQGDSLPDRPRPTTSHTPQHCEILVFTKHESKRQTKQFLPLSYIASRHPIWVRNTV